MCQLLRRLRLRCRLIENRSSLTAALLSSTANAAVVYNFIVAPILGANGQPLDPNEGRTFMFQITGAPTDVPGVTSVQYRAHPYTYTEFGSTTVVQVPAPGQSALGKNIQFFDRINQGGLSTTNSGVRNFFAYGPVLFDEPAYRAGSVPGAPATPIFSLGTFLLSTIPNNPNATRNYSVTITDAAAAVPEPASWAMMIGGLGLVGAALRRRAAVQVRFA